MVDRCDEEIETQMDIMATGRFHTRLMIGGLVGCALAALALTAARFHLAANDPVVAGLAVLAAVWLAWAVFEFAAAPLRAVRVEERRLPPEAIVRQPPFVDTVATWRSP